MRLSSVPFVFALLLSSKANAFINSITVPSIIAPGQPFWVSFNTEDYSQDVHSVVAVAGFAPELGYEESLGTVVDSEYLAGSEFSAVGFTMYIDPSSPDGPAVISVAIFELIGAVASPYTSIHQVPVTVGTQTTSETVTSVSHF